MPERFKHRYGRLAVEVLDTFQTPLKEGEDRTEGEALVHEVTDLIRDGTWTLDEAANFLAGVLALDHLQHRHKS